ncbi:hypothetical protein ACLK1S_12220 [Escherichia coli]
MIRHSQRENRHRAVRWFTSGLEHASKHRTAGYRQCSGKTVITTGMACWGRHIPVWMMQQFLRNAIDKNLDGEYQLHDSKLTFLTSSKPDHPTGNIFDPLVNWPCWRRQWNTTRGWHRMDSRDVSWERLDHFYGVLVRVQTLSEGVRGDFGQLALH